MCQQHEAFSISDSGLRVNLKWPFIGATPDGVVMCECCGTGACEIKVYNLRYYKQTLGMVEDVERAPSNILATPIHLFFHSLYSVHFARKTKKTWQIVQVTRDSDLSKNWCTGTMPITFKFKHKCTLWKSIIVILLYGTRMIYT